MTWQHAAQQGRKFPALLAVALGIGIALAMGVAWWLLWQTRTDTAPQQSIEPVVVAQPQSDPLPSPEPEPPITFTIAATGDMLIHMPVADSAWTDAGWNFVPLLEPIAPYIAGADLALCNMETPLVAPGGTPSGYPQFAAPSELAADMAEIGWDGCSTATNHSLDRGFGGIVDTLDQFDLAGLGHVGTARTEQESNRPQIYELEREGRTITIAHIAGGYDTNGLPLPEEAPWSWTQIDAERMIGEAREARENGADMVLVSAHCCEVEYTTDPEPYQVDLAEALAESGVVDIYIAHHAHVPKTIDLLPGGPAGEGMWTAYGLGNFISNQSTDCCREETSTGLIAYFDVLQEGDDPPVVTGASWVAATMDFTTGHRVRPLRAEGVDGGYMDQAEASRRHALLEAIMEDSPASEREAAPTSTGGVRVLPRS